MTYIERLLLRALAVPRDHAAGLFDPFEQAATWSLDDATTREPAPPVVVRPPDAAVPLQAAPIADALAPSLPAAAMAPTLQPLDSQARPSSQSLLAEAPITSVQPAPVAPNRPLVTPASDPNAEALARADAVMRALSPKAVPVEQPTPSAVASADPATPRPRGVRRTEAETPDTARARQPARILPQPPSPRPTPAAVRAALETPAARAAATTAERPGSPVPARSPAPVPARRSTIVVASDTPRLRDLAHSSSILRFGLGQS
jgi:hypothetical protein